MPWVGTLVIVGTLGADGVKSNFVSLALLLAVYGTVLPGVAYLFSFLFAKHTNAQTFTMLFFYVLTFVRNAMRAGGLLDVR